MLKAYLFLLSAIVAIAAGRPIHLWLGQGRVLISPRENFSALAKLEALFQPSYARRFVCYAWYAKTIAEFPVLGPVSVDGGKLVSVYRTTMYNMHVGMDPFNNDISIHRVGLNHTALQESSQLAHDTRNEK